MGIGVEVAKRSCLVTGGAGFIGSHLVEALINDNWLVKVLDPQCVGSPNLEKVAGQVELIQGDFADTNVVRIALDGVDRVFHYASTTSPTTAYGRSVFDVMTNLVGTLHLLKNMVSCGVMNLVFPSSGGTVYGPATQTPIPESHPTEPICSHGVVKLAIEKYIQLFHRESGLNYLILRYSNPYGPRQRPDSNQGAVAVFTGKVLMRQPIEIWGDGSVVRDFVYVHDIVGATVAALRWRKATNNIINIGSGVGVSIKELLLQIERAVGLTAIVNHLPGRTIDVPASILAIDRARTLLEWRPTTSLEEGLKKTIPWIESYLDRKEKARMLRGSVVGTGE